MYSDFDLKHFKQLDQIADGNGGMYFKLEQNQYVVGIKLYKR